MKLKKNGGLHSFAGLYFHFFLVVIITVFISSLSAVVSAVVQSSGQ